MAPVGLKFDSQSKKSMNSINKNQTEENHKDLAGEEAVSKMKELVNKASSCFFCTQLDTGEFQARPMAVLKIDDAGSLWFLSASDSGKNREIENNPFVKLLFQAGSHSDFLSLSGYAAITSDRSIIKELWNPMFKTWFTKGEDDPRITAIQVAVEEGYYWDTKNPMIVSFLKRIAGALVGKTMDDSIEGLIVPQPA